jgi:hypothetical protein
MNNFDLRKFFKEQYLAESGFRSFNMSTLDDKEDEEGNTEEEYLNPELVKYQGKLSSIVGQLMEINNRIEQYGPLDEEIQDCIEILDSKIEQILKTNK